MAVRARRTCTPPARWRRAALSTALVAMLAAPAPAAAHAHGYGDDGRAEVGHLVVI
jgi:hypothetical protein